MDWQNKLFELLPLPEQLERAQLDFNIAYDHYIGEGFYCHPSNYPPQVKAAYEKLAKVKQKIKNSNMKGKLK